MMRLACVPFPAPGGPSSTTGPTSREVSCAIGLSKAPRPQSPPHRHGCRGAATPHYQRRQRPTSPLLTPLPSTAAANASAARRESVIVAHDQLRLDLLDRI